MDFDLIESTYNICPKGKDKKEYAESVYRNCRRDNPGQIEEVDKAFSFLLDPKCEYNKFPGNATVLDLGRGGGNPAVAATEMRRIENLPLLIQIDQAISYMKRFNYEGRDRGKMIAEVKEYAYDQELVPYILLAILCRNYVYISETHISYSHGYFSFTYLSTLNEPTISSVLQNAKKNWMMKVCIEYFKLTSWDHFERALNDERLRLAPDGSVVSLQFKGNEAGSTNTLKLRTLKYLNSKEDASRKELSQYFEVSDRWMNKILSDLEKEGEIELRGKRRSPNLKYSLRRR